MDKDGATLLLLPPLPSTCSSTSAAIEAAFGPCLDDVFQQHRESRDRRLDVAMSLPSSWLASAIPTRADIFERAQRALGDMYSLIYVKAAKYGLELDHFDGLDARIFYLLHFQEASGQGANTQDGVDKSCSGPYISLDTLIQSQRIYSKIYTTESQDSETILQAFLRPFRSMHCFSPHIARVPGGVTIADSSDISATTSPSDQAHVSVAVGGTFDHLHIGHKLLLTSTALLAEPKGSPWNSSQTVLLTIGISGDDLLTRKKYAEEMESWETRQGNVADFLESVLVFSAPFCSSRRVENVLEPGPNGRRIRILYGSNVMVDYVQISDPFGPTITDRSITALILSEETRSGGKAVNAKRQEKGWPPLNVFEVDILSVNSAEVGHQGPARTTADIGAKISSTDIRRRIHDMRKIS